MVGTLSLPLGSRVTSAGCQDMRGRLPLVRGIGTLSPSSWDSTQRPEPAALVTAGHTSQASSTHSQPRKGVSAEPLPKISQETGLSAALSHVGPGLGHYFVCWLQNGYKDIEGHVEPLSITFHPGLQTRAEAEPRVWGGQECACHFGGVEGLGHVSTGDH